MDLRSFPGLRDFILKIIAPCLLIFSVSVMIINIVFDRFYIGILRENAIQSNLTSLNNLHYNSDGFWQSLVNIKYSLQIDRELKQSYPINEITPVLDLMEKLKIYQLLNPNIGDIGFYRMNEDYIYFSQTSCGADVFFERFQVADPGDKEKIFSGHGELYIPVNDLWRFQESLLLVLPYSGKYTSVNDTIVFFIIPNGRLESFLRPAAGTAGGFAGIFRPGSGFVSSYSMENEKSENLEKELLPITAGYPDGAEYIRRNILGNNYIVAKFQSALGDLSYVTASREDSVLYPIIRIKNNWIAAIFIILGCGIIFMLFIMGSNYKPINENIEKIIIRRTSENVSAAVAEIEKKEKNMLAADMAAYLDIHYNDTQFTLQRMGEYFEMSSPILTKYFRDNHEMTILDYITAVRIKRACAMLSETNTPVKEIGVMVGFTNETSFSRRFRQITGLSPGQYRILKHES